MDGELEPVESVQGGLIDVALLAEFKTEFWGVSACYVVPLRAKSSEGVGQGWCQVRKGIWSRDLKVS